MTKKIVFPKTQKERDKVLQNLVKKRVENVLKLADWSFDDLKELEKTYYDAYSISDCEIIYEKYSQVSEAIEVKKGNEAQAWDFLT